VGSSAKWCKVVQSGANRGMERNGEEWREDTRFLVGLGVDISSK
jgi:hypothetical protein